MPIAQAQPDQLAAVQRLLQTAHYRYLDMGLEDLPALLRQSPTAVGEDAGALWGFLGVQVEERPPTMPAAAPTRAHVRAVAIQAYHRPGRELGELLEVVLRQHAGQTHAGQTHAGQTHAGQTHAVQYLCYGGDYWLSPALQEAGFAQVEAVQFYQLERLTRRAQELPPPLPGLAFSPARPEDLDALAWLDAATFDPLWHFGRRDLFELLLRGRVQVAWWEGELAGYSALGANTRREGQLARLAVHPAFQGRGMGRALLADAIRYAATEYAVLVLNTQVTNTRSQMLYRSLGFRTLGTPIPVFARQEAPRVR